MSPRAGPADGRGTAWAVVLLLGWSRLWFEMSLNVLTELPFACGLLLFCWGDLRRSVATPPLPNAPPPRRRASACSGLPGIGS